jgi:hypothetical protein
MNDSVTSNSALAGAGGFAETLQAATTLAATLSTGTVLTVANASTLGVGETIVIGVEQMTITKVNTTKNTVTVIRGVNGTTPRVHGSGQTVSIVTNGTQANPGSGEGGGLNIGSAATVCLDRFTQSHVTSNTATDSSGDNILGTYSTS